MTEVHADRRSLLVPTVFMLAMCAFLVGLGTWQLQRLKWKEGLIREVSERATQAPVPAPPESRWPGLTQDAIEYSHWQVSGTFDHAGEVQVFANLPDARGAARGVGYWIVTPLVRADGSTILINRGFVPESAKDPAGRPAGQVEGPVTLTGLARWTEDRNLFTPADNPATGNWFTRDIAAIAQAEHLTRVAPFIIDADASAPGGLPQGGETILSFPNNHFQYALTWFGLAIGLVGVYAAMVWRRLSGRG
ncbi:SURF1 family protein [Labrys monachus]|uniref:SURF1-like protein n=1 Tax=Labrys monachus TaxID=217067 RepID=A0ABU0FAB2_9HYPH|nr:SURF1 family protein [Labrys monachus]MDQ0391554.1 surfeit locus 1 family protein [Labrys monachus]